VFRCRVNFFFFFFLLTREAYIYKDEIDWVEDITPHDMFALWEISKRLEIYRLEGVC
jgi:hypothetical protein